MIRHRSIRNLRGQVRRLLQRFVCPKPLNVDGQRLLLIRLRAESSTPPRPLLRSRIIVRRPNELERTRWLVVTVVVKRAVTILT